jgi:hypothetical protein
MIFLQIVLVLGGLFILGVGLWAIYYRSGPVQKLGALCAPVGLLMALIGVLLVCVPDFFSSP